MRLFLASQDLGNYADILQEMVGNKRHAFVISNARDYYNDETRINSCIEKTLVNLNKIGIEAERLDLRRYFDKQAELVGLLEQKQTGLVFSIGGNVFCLATALHASGMDGIIRKAVSENEIVYGGYSAGAMVASCNLLPYNVAGWADSDTVRQTYNVEPYLQGLGLIVQQYIIPHMDRADHIAAMRKRITNINNIGAEAICLNDADVFIVNGNKAQVKRKDVK